jgi:hypothetical protein
MQWFSTGGDFATQGTFGRVWRKFCFPQLRRGMLPASSDPLHPAKHRTATKTFGGWPQMSAMPSWESLVWYILCITFYKMIYTNDSEALYKRRETCCWRKGVRMRKGTWCWLNRRGLWAMRWVNDLKWHRLKTAGQHARVCLAVGANERKHHWLVEGWG